jgi:uncharacterized protein (TIGR03437 family)
LRTGKRSRSERSAVAALVLTCAAVLGGCISDAPHIDAVAPTTAARGTMVTLTGSRFCQGAGVGTDGACAGPIAGKVDFGVDGPVAGQVVSWTDTQVVVVVPQLAATGSSDVYMTSGGLSSNAVAIEVQ